MNSDSRPLIVDRQEALQRQWRQQLAAWRRLLARCGGKPGHKRVHELRVATLRLEALLEMWLGGNEGNAAARAARRWNKQAARLRRVLQPARSAAVYLGKLAWLRKQGITKGASRQVYLRQIAVLERKFVKRRQAAEEELVEEIHNRRARLERWNKGIEDAIPAPVAWGDASGAEAVREHVNGLAAEFPVLSADCLHTYRKRIKKLHYMADFFAADDPHIARQAELLGRMQTVIGEWRDWQLLAQKACRVFKDREGGLSKLLAELEAKSLRKALRDCRRLQEGLLQENAAENPLRKKPVQAVGLENEHGEKQRQSWG
jgi:CHAD domain-containing protein